LNELARVALEVATPVLLWVVEAKLVRSYGFCHLLAMVATIVGM